MFSEVIEKISKKFYPKGRAFYSRSGGVKEQFHKALAKSENRAYSDALAVLDSLLPDTDKFTAEDATDWERRLGLISNPLVALADRKLAITRKIQHPGTIKARQHYKYLEGQLQAAGFDVIVTENRFVTSTLIADQMGVSEMGLAEMDGENLNPDKYEVVDPDTLLSTLVEMGVSEMGVSEMAGYDSEFKYEIAANNIPPELDADFYHDINQAEMGDSEMGVTEMNDTLDFNIALRSTFFVSASSFPSIATISLERKDEFRQLILRLKPANTIAFLFVQYVGDDYNNDYSNDFNNDE